MNLNINKPDERDHRCGCGQLLARLTERGVEIKCKRCRTVQVLPLDTGVES